MTAENIAANTDEYGIIHWENLEIPALAKPGEDLVITYINPDGTRTKEVLKCKATKKK